MDLFPRCGIFKQILFFISSLKNALLSRKRRCAQRKPTYRHNNGIYILFISHSPYIYISYPLIFGVFVYVTGSGTPQYRHANSFGCQIENSRSGTPGENGQKVTDDLNLNPHFCLDSETIIDIQ